MLIETLMRTHHPGAPARIPFSRGGERMASAFHHHGNRTDPGGVAGPSGNAGASRAQIRENCRSSTNTPAQAVHPPLAASQCEISERAETTYLNIIGGMLTLMLGQSPRACLSFQLQNAGGPSSRHWSPHYGTMLASRERTSTAKVRQRQEVRPARGVFLRFSSFGRAVAGDCICKCLFVAMSIE